ncbi:MAG: cytochrome b N-terminal domain-containing protein [Chloroflexota bacterium]|nr:cytochrome b N-terminal domain-containing protein [Chloroflexota bacterium]
MKIYSNWKFRILAGVLLVVLLIVAITTLVHASTASEAELLIAQSTTGLDWSGIESTINEASKPEASVPQPDQSPCLHCHILGENTGIWTPIARWILFGGLGLVFVFGVVRSGTVWRTRKPWKPITTRTFEWVDERYEISEPLSKVLKKPVPKYATRWFYCLGGITAFLFVVQGLTGILLAFYYKPTPDAAFASIQFIENQVRFGSAIRMVHHWAANGMVVMCIAHMLRVFIMGAFKPPRELNWVSGMVLLLITLAFGFTGYLLPWDQRAFWATTVGSEIAGALPVIGDVALVFLRVGWNVTAATLSRFYALHIMVLPLTIVGMMLAHFLMIRRLGVAKPL